MKIANGQKYGIGEVAPIRNLSPENIDEIPERLEEIAHLLANEVKTIPANKEEIYQLVSNVVGTENPSITMGLETAFLDWLNGGEKKIFSNQLANIQIPINGLVWMGDADFMKQQIKEKLNQGFDCIKLKVGALDFETELEIIKELRKISDDLIIRLDANGGFEENRVLFKLKDLSKYDIHSIEQPIMPNQWEAMELICKKTEIPIALDEELIALNNIKNREALLSEVKPHYLVLKPTLHGGFSSTEKWIELAENHEIEWWVTSYLESNIGLNAIAQFVSQYDTAIHHGLGTGNLYTENVSSPILIENGLFAYHSSKKWSNIVFYS